MDEAFLIWPGHNKFVKEVSFLFSLIGKIFQLFNKNVVLYCCDMGLHGCEYQGSTWSNLFIKTRHAVTIRECSTCFPTRVHTLSSHLLIFPLPCAVICVFRRSKLSPAGRGCRISSVLPCRSWHLLFHRARSLLQAFGSPRGEDGSSSTRRRRLWHQTPTAENLLHPSPSFQPS